MSRMDDLRAAVVASPVARRLHGGARQAVASLRYPRGTPEWSAHRITVATGADLLLDVGANVGQYARGIRSAGFTGRILSFEPVSHVRQQLESAAGHDPRWEVLALAAGAGAGTSAINISGNRALSSSLLPMEARHVAAFPDSAYIAQETIQVARLDEVEHPWIGDARRIFIKADTQGFEREVFAGAAGLMDRVVGVRFEVSLTELYTGEWTLGQAVSWLGDQGLALSFVIPGVTDPTSAEMLQVDLLARRGPL